VEAGLPRRDASQLERLDWVGEALDEHRAEWLRADLVLGERQRAAGEEDGAGQRRLLHARRQVRRLAHRRVVHAEVRADGPHHNLARVEPDADGDGHTRRASHLGGVAADRLLHPQRGVARAHGMVLVGEGSAEQRHDAVTHDLVHGALVPVHGLHHVLDDRVQELSRLLGIAVGEQLHRALQVGEEHGHVLALAFQDGL
jgi:hypothetical protein